MEKDNIDKLWDNKGMKYFSMILLLFLIIYSIIYPSIFYSNWPYIIMLLFILLFFSLKDKKITGFILISLFVLLMILMQFAFYYIIPIYNNYQPTPTLPLMKIFNIDNKFQVSYYPDMPKGGDNIVLYLDICTLDSSNCTNCEICNLSGYFINEEGKEKYLFENVSLNNTPYIEFPYPGKRVNILLNFEGVDKRYNTFYIPKLNFWETIIIVSEEHPVYRTLSIISILWFVITILWAIQKLVIKYHSSKKMILIKSSGGIIKIPTS